jgi:hypothetical protein
MSVGMRKLSLAHAPKSMFLHRSLQKGRNALLGAKMLSPPHVGQTTIFETGFSMAMTMAM